MQVQEKWINDFISLGKEVVTKENGKDTKVRPDTKTSIAIGKVFQLEEKGKNNLKAVVRVSGAKYDFSGFLNDNSPVSDLIKQAKEMDVAIAVRFEKKRKKGVSLTTSIEDLARDASTAKDNIVNIVAGVYNFSTKAWILTDDAVSNPEEDPEYVSAGLNSATYDTDNFFSGPKSTAPRIETGDADWKANHLLSMYNFGAEHNSENNIGLEQKTIKVLAIYMLRACDQLQMKIYEVGEPNYNNYSHTKARGMLFSWMKLNPLSAEIMSKKGGFNEWITRFLDESTELWEWAKEEANK